MHPVTRPRRHLLRARLVGVAAIVGVLGVAGAVSAPAASAASSGKSSGKSAVKIKTFQFRPDPVEVDAGTKVVWKNRDAIEHTVTSTSGTPAFDGTLSGKGSSFSVRLDDPGTYEYACKRHPSMEGSVVVR